MSSYKTVARYLSELYSINICLPSEQIWDQVRLKVIVMKDGNLWTAIFFPPSQKKPRTLYSFIFSKFFVLTRVKNNPEPKLKTHPGMVIKPVKGHQFL